MFVSKNPKCWSCGQAVRAAAQRSLDTFQVLDFRGCVFGAFDLLGLGVLGFYLIVMLLSFVCRVLVFLVFFVFFAVLGF